MDYYYIVCVRLFYLECIFMDMQSAPKGLRLHIGIFGKRNAGKSSLLNAVAGQDVVIVSAVPGTTADPVEKAMELPPIGPVLLIDTAGFDDDQQELGEKRIQRTMKVLDHCDIALLVSNAEIWNGDEERFLADLNARRIPTVIVFNKKDEIPVPETFSMRFASEKQPFTALSAATGDGIARLRENLILLTPDDFLNAGCMLGDLVRPGSAVLLITPIDKEAPKGRMILPQVQAIRDTLDHDSYCIVTTERNVEKALANLKEPPCLAVTDSQVFGTVASSVPPSVPLTSFSILLARLKGDLAVCAAGAAAISRLKDGAKVLIAEACTHHPIEEDIGRVKLPNWLKEYTGKNLTINVVSGPDFPDDLAAYDLVIHCGACTFNRKNVLSRILRCQAAGVPFTNYGVAIAFVKGILKRALIPFPAALAAYEKESA